MIQIDNYIDGLICPPVSGLYLENPEPATGKAFSKVADSDNRDVELAVVAAQKAQAHWAAMPQEQRSRILIRISDLIEKNIDLLAEAESVDNGKPVWLAKVMDIPRAASNFYFYATEAMHLATEAHITDTQTINYTVRKPVGIAGCISPWNLPLYLFSWKIAPALAMGNCVIAKPSEITPYTAYLLSKLCVEAGLPAGVLNIIHGSGPKVGAAISSHPHIPVISFTGGTKTGAEISRVAAPMFKKLSLELGGKNPNLVFEDCDLDKAIRNGVNAAFTNQGEICLCGSRIFIHRPIYDKYKEGFLRELEKRTVGDPQHPDTKLGAIVSQMHFEKVLGYIELAKAEGGKILAGGHPVNLEGRCKDGWFIAPTVIEGLPYTCRTNQEEIFGPVVTLTPFDTEEEALEMANSTQYGLAATVWTENLSRAHRVAAKLESGIVWINCWLVRDLRTPFGGVKNSGLGREGGFEALKFFTEEKNVCIRL